MAGYNPPRKRNLFDPVSELPFKLSRSKIDSFLKCPRCFYFDRRLGVDVPSGPSFSLNSAVDVLLKNEFDILRKKKEPHELMKKYGVDAIPYDHPDLPVWRDDVHTWEGVKHYHEKTNLVITGIIDDIWIDKKGNMLIVDYKSTSTERILSLEDEYKQGYKKQIEVYQWIFRKNGFPISKTAYFVFANAKKNRPQFDGKLEFEIELLPHQGDDSWVEGTIYNMKKNLMSSTVPESSTSCEYCKYRNAIKGITKQFGQMSFDL